MLHKCVSYPWMSVIFSTRTVKSSKNHSDFSEYLLHVLFLPLAQQQQPLKPITSKNAAK